MAKDRARTVAVIFGGLAVIGLASWAGWLALDAISKAPSAGRMNALVHEIVSLLDLEATPDFHQRLDKVRSFINDHSVHKIEKGFWANHGDAAAYAAGVIAHANGTAAEPSIWNAAPESIS